MRTIHPQPQQGNIANNKKKVKKISNEKKKKIPEVKDRHLGLMLQ